MVHITGANAIAKNRPACRPRHPWGKMAPLERADLTLGWFRRLKPWQLLGGYLLLTCLVVGAWISLDKAIGPPPDSEQHLLLCQLYARSLALGGPSAAWDAMQHHPVQWAPLSHVMLGVLAHLVGSDPVTIRLLNLLAAPLLVAGVFFLGAAMGGRLAGTLAALLTLLSLGVTGQLRQISPDLYAAALVPWCLWALHRSQSFSRTWPTLLFGALVGLSVITRVQALFFLVGPSLLAVASALWRGEGIKGRAVRFGRMVAGLAVLLAVSSVWWASRLGPLWALARDHVGDSDETPPAWGDPTFWGGLQEFVGDLGRMTAWLTLAVALIALPLLLRRRLAAAAMLLSWIVGGMALYALTISRHEHYMLPALPGLAILIALGLEQAPRKFSRPAGAVLLLWGGLSVLTAASLGTDQRDALEELFQDDWVPYAYVRLKEQEAMGVKLAARVRPPLVQAMGGPSRGGYLLFVPNHKLSLLPRMVCHMSPGLPGLLYSSNWEDMATTALHRGHRNIHPMFLLSERKVEGWAPVWTGKWSEDGQSLEYHLYLVPAGHPIKRDGVDAEQRLN